jgi:hypothetical protein
MGCVRISFVYLFVRQFDLEGLALKFKLSVLEIFYLKNGFKKSKKTICQK